MMKNLLTVAAIALTCGLSAQNGRSAKASAEQIKLNIESSAVLSKPAANTTCDSIVTMNLQTATVSIYTALSDTSTPGCVPKAGYVDGNNCYDDREKANFNDGSLYGSISNVSVTAVKVMLYRDAANGAGTQGGVNATVGAKIYNGSLAGGPTGAALGTISNPMATVLASHVNTASDFFFHEFTFVTPVPVQSTGFFASIELPSNTNVGDTAVIASQVSPPANIGWEKWNDNSWHAYSSSWNTNKNMLIIPKYCFALSGAGISTNMGISKNIDIYPNPSNNGNVKIATTFVTRENLSISVTNALGKVVYSSNESAMVNVLDLDLSNQANGVYFINISNGTDKMVARLILNK